MKTKAGVRAKGEVRCGARCVLRAAWRTAREMRWGEENISHTPIEFPRESSIVRFVLKHGNEQLD
jgi:hypothetical protein